MNDYKIYAVDGDGTLWKNEWPGIGKPNKRLIRFCKRKQSKGHKLILWTCRCGDKLVEAVKWCEQQGLIFDEINDNIQEMNDLFGTNSRKVFASYYIDDKSIGFFKMLIWKYFR